jgi:hypothetical protein
VGITQRTAKYGEILSVSKHATTLNKSATNHHTIAKVRLFAAHRRLCRSYKSIKFEKCAFVEKYINTFAGCEFSFQMLTVCRIVFHFLQSLQSLPEYFVFIHYWFLKFY